MNKVLCLFTALTLCQVAGRGASHGRPPRLVSSPTGTQSLSINIYDFTIKDIDGNDIELSQYKGKKILFVNTASNSSYTSQYASLEQLYQKYKDSLVIIAIPSNSFGNETGDDAEVKKFIDNTYNIHFIITEKTIVSGESISPLYSWLTDITQNTMMDNKVTDDFYKFLVDGSGRLVGAFVSSVDPMSDEVQSAIASP